jgi:hypothetical protein
MNVILESEKKVVRSKTSQAPGFLVERFEDSVLLFDGKRLLCHGMHFKCVVVCCVGDHIIRYEELPEQSTASKASLIARFWMKSAP